MSAGGFDFREFFAKAREVHDRQVKAAVNAIDQYGEVVLGAAAELAPRGGPSQTPRDPAPGTLKESATAEPAVLEDGKISKKIGFNTEYAAVQHEDLEFGHNPPGQAKYLETALREMAPKMGPFVAEKIKTAGGE